MREILFRGKRVNNGEWVEDYYVNVIKPYCVLSSFNKAFGTYIIASNNEMIEVIPETVGQYTGLTDKSGKKIFEGDIVLVNDDDTEKGCVVWDNTELEYGIDIGSVRLKMGCFYSREIEVIGNIYDDPGLLKGSTE